MFGVRLSKMGSASKLGLIAKAIGILRKYGADAHVYLPGIGTVNGLTAGNYLDSAGTTAATVDNPVGLVIDSFGSINATQGTTANKPILRQSGGKYSWQFDGSNDSLLTGNLGITNTVSVVIAGRLNSLSAIQVLFYEDIGGFGLYLSAAGAVLFSNVGAGTIVASGAGTLAVGVPFVITVRLQGGTAVIRKDGVQIATGSTALIFSATTGARIGTGFSGTTDPLNGSLNSVEVITATTTDSELLILERLAGQLLGVSL